MYANSATGGTADFYAAFPESAKASLALLESTPPSTISWVNKEKLKITVTTAPASTTSFNFKIDSMKNPFSAVQ